MNLTDPEAIDAHYTAEIDALDRTLRPPQPALPEEIDDYTMVAFAERFAIWAHGAQRYGASPYKVHLKEVVAILDHHGFDVHYHPLTVITGWCHDVIEDTGVTRDAFADLFGDACTDMVWACTGEGATRREKQASIKRKLLACEDAQPAKGADRLANMRASLRGKITGLVKMYSGEFDDFMTSVPSIPASMRDELLAVQAQSLEYLKSNP